MAETLVYNVRQEPKGSAYPALLDFCARHGASCSLAERNSSQAQSFAAIAQPYLIRTEAVSSWPGTQLYGHTAKLSFYLLAPEMLDLLRTTVRSLFGWLGPDLPEDLAVYRRDRSLFLASIAHERDAWFELTDAERRDLARLSIEVEAPTAKHQT